MARYTRTVSALLGAVVTILLGFVPLSPIFGGALAGYLHGRDGVRVGALSGLFAAIPGAVVALAVVSLLTIVPPGEAGASILLFLVVALVVFLATAVYTVALSALGGYLGVYLYEDRTDRDGGDRHDADEVSEAAVES